MEGAFQRAMNQEKRVRIDGGFPLGPFLFLVCTDKNGGIFFESRVLSVKTPSALKKKGPKGPLHR